MQAGKFEVILGPMFSGKSTELIRKLTRAQIAGKSVILFKPKIDDRYHATDVVSHDGSSFPATAVDSTEEVLDALHEGAYGVVGFDEAQFFNLDIHKLANTITVRLPGTHVIMAGLNTDFTGKPFPTMVDSVFRADSIEYLSAVCIRCGNDAVRNQRIINGIESISGEIVSVGGADSYEARCRDCFVEC